MTVHFLNVILAVEVPLLDMADIEEGKTVPELHNILGDIATDAIKITLEDLGLPAGGVKHLNRAGSLNVEDYRD